jgi:hypothetical protein
MYEIFKTEKFAILFSFIIGFGLIAVMIPVCKGDDCIIQKAPSVEEIKTSTFKIGSKCYQFKADTVQCPVNGAIEAFTRMY